MASRIGAIIFAGTLVLALLLAGSAMASPRPISELIREQSFSVAVENAQVNKAIGDGKAIEFLVRNKDSLARKELDSINSPTELSYGEPFKVYIANKSVAQALIDNKPITDLIKQCAYYWEVPIVNSQGIPVASSRVEFFQGKWLLVEVGGSLSPGDLATASDPVRLSGLFGAKGIKDGESYVHLAFPSLHSDFLVIQSEDNEFLTPLIYGPKAVDVEGLKRGEVYSRQQTASAIGPILKRLADNPGLESGRPMDVVSSNKGSQRDSGNPLSVLYYLLVLPVALIVFYAYRNLNHSAKGKSVL